MKRKILITAIILAVLTCFLTVGAFAAEDNAASHMPFVDTEEISPESPSIQTEGDLMEEFNEMFGENGGKILSVATAGAFSMFLFLPSLVLVIIFGVLNSKTKKKIKEYERFFGPVPQNTPVTYNNGSYNGNYYTQPVNPTNAPMGNAPAGNYAPQGNVNNQQGGSF